MSDPIFPAKLLDWAGHRSGGVRKLFHQGAARPSGDLIRTSLLERLETWVSDFLEGKPSTPRIVLLVGGPGNGKTEAIEACIRRIDEAGALGGKLVGAFSTEFSAGTGRPVPRLASVDVGVLSNGQQNFDLAIVQDASVEDPALANKTPPQLLVMDLEKYALSSSGAVYLACVNRGVLDDAFGVAIDSHRDDARKFLAQVIRAVGLTSDAPSCWPLDGYPHVAIWPMDVESLLVPTLHSGLSPGQQLLQIATKVDYWPAAGSCPAGESCPHCTSRKWLDDDRRRTGLLKLLRWYELVSGKRWSFRDLGSLLSFLLAGFQGPEGGTVSPCEAAAKLLALDGDTTRRRTPLGNQAIFLLVSALYQHALYGVWPQFPARALRKDIRELKLENEPTLMGLQHFLNGQRRRSLPSTLERQLESISVLMDPALADPDEDIQITSRTSIKLRAVDARFSQSVSEGLAFISPYRILAPLEVEILKRLAKADQELSIAEIRNRRPAAAARVQMQVREFACRLVRRSLGVQSGAARDAAILGRFEQVIQGDAELTRRVVKQVETLLNAEDSFTTSLNTTFGEPSPPESRRSMLTTPKQRVRLEVHPSEGRPPATLLFLAVGNQGTRQSVPLTFELFKSVSELDLGLLPAVLPRTVVALLDTTRARLSGQIVRDEELLDGAEIRIGLRSEVIVREAGRFVVQRDTP